MKPYLDDGDVRIFAGDCVEVMREMPEASVDAICTDPPYGLEFMGKEWDSFRQSNAGVQLSGFEKLGKNGTPTFSPNRRNQKCPACGKWAYDHDGRKCECGGWKQPAQRGYALAFQAWCETWAREALRVLRPGGHLLAFGGTRTFHRLTCALEDAGFEIRDCLSWLYGSGFPKSLAVDKAIDREAGAEREVVGEYPVTREFRGRALVGDESHVTTVPITAPATPDAARWQGWGTALKPAHEPIVLARKPVVERTIARQVLATGTGALNVDGCRIGEAVETWPTSRSWNGWAPKLKGDEKGETQETGAAPAGRWPANVVLDEEAARALDDASGERPSGSRAEGVYGGIGAGAIYGDGGPTRLGAIEANTGGASRFFYTAKAGREERDGSKHPTVKPLALMRWLVRLVTPPGGVCLDPFAGSGTTLLAARQEGFLAIGIEREPEYLKDAANRLRQLSLFGELA